MDTLTPEQFRLNIYSQVAAELNRQKIPHCMLHGMLYQGGIVGRDLDLQIRKKDRYAFYEVLCEIFHKNGVNIKRNSIWGVDLFFGYKIIDGNYYFIEIDIAFGYYYHFITLTLESRLGFDTQESTRFYVDNYNALAKSFLLRIYANQFETINNNRKNEAIILANNMLLDGEEIPIDLPLKNELLTNIAVYNENALRSIVDKLSPYRYVLSHPLESICVFLKSVCIVIVREVRKFHAIPLFIIEHFDFEEANMQINVGLKDSFITKKNSRDLCGKKLTIGRFLLYVAKTAKKSQPLDLNVWKVAEVSWMVLALGKVLHVYFIPHRVVADKKTVNYIVSKIFENEK